jgi:hypothetical protein
MKNQLFYSIASFGFGFLGLQAQTMYIRPHEGVQTSYDVGTIQKFTFPASGILQVTTSIGSTDYTTIGLRYLNFTNLLLGINSSKLADKNILVYPNPVKEFIRFVLPEESENLTSVEIFSLNGNLVLEDKAVGLSNQLNVSNLACGLYLCKINWGASSQTIKILKE